MVDETSLALCQRDATIVSRHRKSRRFESWSLLSSPVV
jgi:hypothetical protein